MGTKIFNKACVTFIEFSFRIPVGFFGETYTGSVDYCQVAAHAID